MTPRPPELIDDAITEILLRLPPDDPGCLVRSSLVCKLWRRILSDSTFPHLYRKFHRTPPLLGFLGGFFHSSDPKRFIPIMTRIPFLEPAFGCQVVDCCHGRVLFDLVYGRGTRGSGLAVWDPITGDHKLLSDPYSDKYYRSGAVLCVAAGCDHRCCHDGPFLVVLVGTSYRYKFVDTRTARAWVYSSETAAWSTSASVQLQHDGCSVAKRHGAIVGDQIYFLLDTGAEILKYDLGKQCLTIIGSPGRMYFRPVLITMKDGSSLGFIGVKDSTLHLWVKTVNPDESMGWVRDRVILLNNLVPRNEHTHRLVAVSGFAEGVDIVLLNNGAATFIFDLKSERFRKLNNHKGCYYDDFPYMTFYIPDFASSKLPQPVEVAELKHD